MRIGWRAFALPADCVSSPCAFSKCCLTSSSVRSAALEVLAGSLRASRGGLQRVSPCERVSPGVVAEAADGTALSSVVSLKAPSVGVLLILRNAQTHLELCVFTRKPDLASGLPAALSLLEGSFDEEGLFDGPCAALVEEALGSPIKRSEVLDLQTPLVASEEPSPGMEFAAAPEVLVAPSASKTPPQESALDAAARLGPVRSQLLLCRRTLQPSALAALEAKLGRTRRLGQQATPATPDTAPAALGLRCASPLRPPREQRLLFFSSLLVA